MAAAQPITILFTDVQNSTGISFRLGDPVYTQQLHGPHHQTLKREIERHGGTLHLPGCWG